MAYHYLYTREGAELALGKTSIKHDVKRALEDGYAPFKENMDSVRYYDIDVLLKNYEGKQKIVNITMEEQIHRQIKKKKRKKSLQLFLPF